MKLQNEKMAGLVLAIGQETVVLDARGSIETDDKDVIASLTASGFVPVYTKAKVEAKIEPAKIEEPKVEVKIEEPKFDKKGKNRG